jgi:pimeloyl-ACP methyl ester carboxylesterase
MANYVLVPGAWLGAWAWDSVTPLLTGHGVFPVTLSGLAERRDAGASVGLAQHVLDIVRVVESNDLRDVVLVGHSYSGIPVGQAAGMIGDRLRRVFYVDSNVAVDGESFVDGWSAEGRAWVLGVLEECDGYWPPLTAEEYSGQDLSDASIDTIVSGSTPHPGRSITEPAQLARPLSELPTTYLKCLTDGPTPSPVVQALLKSQSWTLAELNTGHWPMFSDPAALAKLLLEPDLVSG